MFRRILAAIGHQEHKGKDRKIHEFAVHLIDNVRLYRRHSEQVFIRQHRLCPYRIFYQYFVGKRQSRGIFHQSLA